HFVEHDLIDAKTNNDIQWGMERTSFKHISWIDSRIDTTRSVYVRHRVIPVAEESRPIVYSRANSRAPDSTTSIWTGAQQSLFFANVFTKGVNTIEINFQGTSALLDYYQILYWLELEPINGVLQFIGSDSPATYLTSGWSEEPLVFDITEQTNLRLMGALPLGGGRYAFSDSLGGRQYYAVRMSNAARAPFPVARELANLRERAFNSDLLILLPRGLENDLDRYISYREARGTSVDWVFVEDVMQEFGFGMNDPTAIRDFLRYVWLYAESAPEFVMLVGDATWDPKGITDPPPTYCPAALCVANASDDYFYSVTYGDAVPDYAGGRVPVNTINDWRHFVDKVIRTEGEPEFGTWRTRFVYCADDDRKTGNLPDTWTHTIQTSNLVRGMPAWTEPRTIYVADYPMTSLGFKPAAQRDLLEYWNDGAQLVNYVGHGNYRLWTHEEVFEATSCVGRLNNNWKLPLMVSASCEVGLFYRIVGQSIAEQVLLRPESGAVASIAATRMTLAHSNGVFNDRLLEAGWKQGRKERLGVANLYAKGGNTWSSTPGQYVLFGDPAMEIGPPELDIALRVEPDSLLAGEKIRVSGEVLADSAIAEDFDGTVHLLVYDSGYMKTNYSAILSQSATYYEGGKRIFNGPVDVIGGRFEAEFFVPIDISYGTADGKIVAYGYNEHIEAAGFLSDMTVTGDTSLVITDSTGPDVAISFDGAGFGDGGVLCGGGTLIITVADESGINLSGGAGHALTMTLNGNEAGAIDLSPYFEYHRNSYQSGEAQYPMDNLPAGMHTVRVKAWDNFGNSGTGELSFEVADCGVAISNPLAYPNPFSAGTEITFNIGSPADVTVSIFTTTGRPVRKLDAAVSPAFASIYWDGNDSHGTPVANGAFIVKIEAKTEDGETDDRTFKIAKLR
ncbi:MAG TPA: hypothetical protein ENN07_08540, partial [candidate division Zixibacteria bacterium]|nr:hypothetical protein [candidate division Zixibacteria bacterium]